MGQRMAIPLFLRGACMTLSLLLLSGGVSKDPLFVYASSIFAMLSLRFLYTASLGQGCHGTASSHASSGHDVEIRRNENDCWILLISDWDRDIVGRSVLAFRVRIFVWENNKRLRNVQLLSVTLPSWTNMALTT